MNILQRVEGLDIDFELERGDFIFRHDIEIELVMTVTGLDQGGVKLSLFLPKSLTLWHKLTPYV